MISATITHKQISLNHDSITRYLFDYYGLDKVDSYSINKIVECLESTDGLSPEIESAIISACTVGESFFLRHQYQLDWITANWLPKIISWKTQHILPHQISILSAGCSTGEEPYTLKAILKPLLPLGWKLDIHALDLSPHAIQAANKGEYSLWSLRGVSIDQNPWLTVAGRKVYVADWVKKDIHFFAHNLMDPINRYPNYFDLVLCRNVMIYFHEEALKKLWNHLLGTMLPTGTIIPGPSDPSPETKDIQVIWEDNMRFCCLPENPIYSSLSKTTVKKATPEPKEVVARQRKPKKNLAKTQEKPPTKTTSEPEQVKYVPHVESSSFQFEKAEKDYTTILRLTKGRHLDIALELLQKQTTDSPLHVPSHILRTLVANELEQHDIALESARRAVYLAPDAPYPIFVMADVLERLGKNKQAKSKYRWVQDLIQKMDMESSLEYSENLTVRQLKEIMDGRKESI